MKLWFSVLLNVCVCSYVCLSVCVYLRVYYRCLVTLVPAGCRNNVVLTSCWLAPTLFQFNALLIRRQLFSLYRVVRNGPHKHHTILMQLLSIKWKRISPKCSLDFKGIKIDLCLWDRVLLKMRLEKLSSIEDRGQTDRVHEPCYP